VDALSVAAAATAAGITTRVLYLTRRTVYVRPDVTMKMKERVVSG